VIFIMIKTGMDGASAITTTDPTTVMAPRIKENLRPNRSAIYPMGRAQIKEVRLLMVIKVPSSAES
jgi:hypothetical protein